MNNTPYETQDFDKDDIFSRKQYALNLSTIIRNSCNYTTEGALTIALDSEFGTGKSTFISKWMNELNKDNDNGNNDFPPFIIIHYNAWENDNWENAFIPLINYLINNINSSLIKDLGTKIQKVKTTAWNLIKYSGKTIVKGVIKKKLGEEFKELIDEFDDIDTLKQLDPQTIEKILEQKSNDKVTLFEEFKQSVKVKEDVTNSLTDLAIDNKVVIFIDELDRCNPLFAINTLECIKHLLNIPNMVFVLSTDIQQLKHSIKTVYGEGMDSLGYLRRFFNLYLKLPNPTLKEYTAYKIQSLSLDETGMLNRILPSLFEGLSLSLRDIDSLSINIKILLDTTLKNYKDNESLTSFYIYLLILKYKYPEEYNIIISKSFSTEKNDVPKYQPHYIDKKLYSFGNEAIKLIVSSLIAGQNLKPVSSLFESNGEYLKNKGFRADFNNVKHYIITQSKILFIDPIDLFDDNAENNLNLRIGTYMERKLEVFNAI